MSVPFNEWSKKEKDDFAQKKMEEMKSRNEMLRRRHAEVQRDRVEAEANNSSVTSLKAMPTEKSVASGDVTLENTEFVSKPKVKEREWDRGKPSCDAEGWITEGYDDCPRKWRSYSRNKGNWRSQSSNASRNHWNSSKVRAYGDSWQKSQSSNQSTSTYQTSVINVPKPRGRGYSRSDLGQNSQSSNQNTSNYQTSVIDVPKPRGRGYSRSDLWQNSQSSNQNTSNYQTSAINVPKPRGRGYSRRNDFVSKKSFTCQSGESQNKIKSSCPISQISRHSFLSSLEPCSIENNRNDYKPGELQNEVKESKDTAQTSSNSDLVPIKRPAGDENNQHCSKPEESQIKVIETYGPYTQITMKSVLIKPIENNRFWEIDGVNDFEHRKNRVESWIKSINISNADRNDSVDLQPEALKYCEFEIPDGISTEFYKPAFENLSEDVVNLHSQTSIHKPASASPSEDNFFNLHRYTNKYPEFENACDASTFYKPAFVPQVVGRSTCGAYVNKQEKPLQNKEVKKKPIFVLNKFQPSSCLTYQCINSEEYEYPVSTKKLEQVPSSDSDANSENCEYFQSSKVIKDVIPKNSDIHEDVEQVPQYIYDSSWANKSKSRPNSPVTTGDDNRKYIEDLCKSGLHTLCYGNYPSRTFENETDPKYFWKEFDDLPQYIYGDSWANTSESPPNLAVTIPGDDNRKYIEDLCKSGLHTLRYGNYPGRTFENKTHPKYYWNMCGDQESEIFVDIDVTKRTSHESDLISFEVAPTSFVISDSPACGPWSGCNDDVHLEDSEEYPYEFDLERSSTSLDKLYVDVNRYQNEYNELKSSIDEDKCRILETCVENSNVKTCKILDEYVEKKLLESCDISIISEDSLFTESAIDCNFESADVKNSSKSASVGENIKPIFNTVYNLSNDVKMSSEDDNLLKGVINPICNASAENLNAITDSSNMMINTSHNEPSNQSSDDLQRSSNISIGDLNLHDESEIYSNMESLENLAECLEKINSESCDSYILSEECLHNESETDPHFESVDIKMMPEDLKLEGGIVPYSNTAENLTNIIKDSSVTVFTDSNHKEHKNQNSEFASSSTIEENISLVLNDESTISSKIEDLHLDDAFTAGQNTAQSFGQIENPVSQNIVSNFKDDEVFACYENAGKVSDDNLKNN